jgi:transcriptional regulator with XRE-family HTH domain
VGFGDMAAPGASITAWQPVAYRTVDGDLVDAWKIVPPSSFPQRLVSELDRLRREAREATAACGAALIDVQRVTVKGCLALRRIERLPPGASPLGAVFAATLIVVRDHDLGVEITVTCTGPSGSSPDERMVEAAERSRWILGKLEPSISILWDIQSLRQRGRRRPRGGLARARRATGMTQAELAANVGVSLTAVSQWERGVNGVDVRYYQVLAEKLGISVAEVARLVEVDEVESAMSYGPGAEVWEIPVPYLPWRPRTALTGPAGVSYSGKSS